MESLSKIAVMKAEPNMAVEPKVQHRINTPKDGRGNFKINLPSR